MANGWSIDGKRVELKPGFGGGKLLIDGVETGMKIPNSKAGSYPLEWSGRNLVVQRTQKFTGMQTQLVSDGVTVPASPKALPLTRAPNEARCANHAASAAVIACARCGGFVCKACAAADGVRCKPCFDKASTEARKAAQAAAYFAPVVVFVVLAGLLGGLFAGLAGAAAVAVAKRTERRAVKLGFAILFYAIAAVLTIAAATAIQLARK